MKKYKFYQIDSFTKEVFKGNPAGVCLLDEWIPDDLMQSIATENNLSETAFIVPKQDDYEIRWFTPAVEVDLCGHATLAAGFVFYELLGFQKEKISFISPKSGLLSVSKKNEFYFLNFPSDEINPITDCSEIENCIGVKVMEAYKGKTDVIAFIENENTLQKLTPNFKQIAQLKGRGLIVTAPGNTVDFVSRFFAPQAGIDEDPVTGSTHTSLTPLWSKKLNKEKLTAKQLSKRVGDLICEYQGQRCSIGGQAVLYLEGEISIA